MDIIKAAMAWRKSWVDVEDLQEEESGCNCELCQLIRACNEYAAQPLRAGDKCPYCVNGIVNTGVSGFTLTCKNCGGTGICA